RSQGGGGGPAASHVSARGSARDQGEPEPARKARDCGRGSSAGAAATSGGGGQPRAQRSGQAPPAIDEPSDEAVSAFDVSVGNSLRQSFVGLAPCLARLEADGAVVMGPAQPDMVRRQVEWIEGGVKAAGRRREDIEIELMATVAPSPDDVRSWASTQARLLGHYRDLPESLLRFRDEIAASA